MTEESARVQNYIDVHRNLVLRDALHDLENCDNGNLPKLIHRLKGTLGSFQFEELSGQLKVLYQTLLSKGNGSKLTEEVKAEAISIIKNQIQTEVK